MSTRRETRHARPASIGVMSAVLGLIGLAGFAWTWVLTAGSVDPPEWLRIAGVWLMPIGIIGALVTGIMAVRGPGRAWAITGIVLAGAAVLGFVLLISLWQY